MIEWRRPSQSIHLPTAGGAPATTAVPGNHAQLWPSPPALALPHVKAGKMRALATWGATRLAKAMQDPEFKSAMDKVQLPIAYQDAR